MTTWSLIAPPVAPPGVIESGTPAALDSAIDVGVPLYSTADDFLDLVDRLLPDWYLDPLKSGQGPGYELLQAWAAMFERCSRAVGRFEVGNYLMFSSGPAPSVASVEFYRPSLGTGAFTVKAGTVISCSKSGRQFVLLVDVALGSTDYYVGALVESVGRGPEYDVPGPIVTADGTRLPGEIDTLVLPFTDPVYADPYLAVRQVTDAVGGSAPVVDQLGHDRGIDRLSGEPDAVYKRRARALPDTVSPAAIRRQMDAAWFSRNLPYDLIETWEHRYQSCWDAPLGTIVHPQQGTLAEDTWCWDDPREDRFAGRWMSLDDCPSGYVLVVPQIPCLADRGMVWDDPAADFTGIRSDYGLRADSVWDGPIPDGSRYYSGCWDGADAQITATIAAIWAQFKKIKGAGVSVAFVLAGADQAELAVPVTFPPLPVSI